MATPKFREPLLLFSHRLECTTCTEAINRGGVVSYRAEVIGIGPGNARQRTHHLLSEGDRPRLVLSLGSAGWIASESPPEQPVWAREVKSPSGAVFRASLPLSPNRMAEHGLRSGRLVTTRRPITGYELGRELAQQVGAEMVDMEGHAVLEVCLDANVPCGVIRAATDRASEKAVREYRQNVAGAMARLGESVGSLLRYLEAREVSRRLKLSG